MTKTAYEGGDRILLAFIQKPLTGCWESLSCIKFRKCFY